MRTLPLLASCGAVAASVSAAVMLFANPRSETASGEQTTASELAALRTSVDELSKQNEDLRGEIAGLRTAAPASAISREPVLEDLVERAVAKAMANYASAQPGPPSTNGPRSEPGAAFDADASLAGLLSPFINSDSREQLWKAAHEAGMTEELIALVEARAKADPKNVALQFELANAYLQPIVQGEAIGIDAGTWSMKADQGYDAVLALDENHWEARFSKAISYSFWPPVFGKQQAAIDHFEILVSKQGNMTPRPEFAQTYLFLGNMYEQSGNTAKAKEAWNLGIAAFPQDRDLRQRLGLE